MALIYTNIKPKDIFADALVVIKDGECPEVPWMSALTNPTTNQKYKNTLTVFKKDSQDHVYYDALNMAKASGFESVIISINEPNKQKTEKEILAWLREERVSAMKNPFIIHLSIE